MTSHSTLSINDLLVHEGVDLAGARFVRHQDTRSPTGRTPYSLWLANDGSFEAYQAIQETDRFPRGAVLASFVVSPLGETIFVGTYEVEAIGEAPPGHMDALHGHDVTGLCLYNLQPTPVLTNFRGRIVVDWGPGARAWVQRADRQDKPILEIKRSIVDPPFPGFDAFLHTVKGLDTVPLTWRTALSAVSGVYLLTSIKTGKHYVGSATGTAGFWGRWAAYAANGHGGNEALKLAAEDDYYVTILEVAASSSSAADVLRREELWKRKLRTRRYGSNL